ncbi:MAG: cytochrome C biogenesis protein CcmH [Methylobacter sp.]|nr:MAG: cytochrome C biogenesis protein CcmH [Methylobacter sp.]
MKPGILMLLLLLSPFAAQAIDSRQFANPEQQEAYETLTAELRCLVCQNQTIADSNAELAADLRRQVQEMLEQGKSREEIVQFMTDRYGDFVLYKPPFKLKTGLLWLGPIVFLLLGLVAVFFVIRQRQPRSQQGFGIPTLPGDKEAAAVTENGQAEKLAKIRRLLDEGDVS